MYEGMRERIPEPLIGSETSNDKWERMQERMDERMQERIPSLLSDWLRQVT